MTTPTIPIRMSPEEIARVDELGAPNMSRSATYAAG
jgi:hypothetical protein